MSLRFSERFGYKQIRESLQLEKMDRQLRMKLWNVFYDYYGGGYTGANYFDSDLESLKEIIWTDFYVFSLDEFPYMNDEFINITKNFFQEKFDWFEVYDFIEFIAKNDWSNSKEEFIDDCNDSLEKEMSAYRLISETITPIVDDIEIKEIEKVLDNNQFDYMKVHFAKAIEFLSDRKNPDFRNSIKESISAVESVVKLITKDSKSELGKALNVLEKHQGIQLHGALKSGFSSIYGYTSDSDGIRHALTEDSSVTFEDAKFMLVSCSAFVNYLIAKSEKVGLDLYDT